ncbi:MAG: hypothetical protein K1V89_10110, partial [Muribaculaceae bacterium]
LLGYHPKCPLSTFDIQSITQNVQPATFYIDPTQPERAHFRGIKIICANIMTTRPTIGKCPEKSDTPPALCHTKSTLITKKRHRNQIQRHLTRINIIYIALRLHFTYFCESPFIPTSA